MGRQRSPFLIFMHCLLIFFSWGLLAPKPLGVFRYRLLSYTSTWDCSSMLNLRKNIGFNIASGISCMLLGGSYLYLELSKYSEEEKVTWFSITHTIIPLIFLLFWAGIALIFYHYIVIMFFLECLVTSLIPLSFSYLRIKRKENKYITLLLIIISGIIIVLPFIILSIFELW